MKTVSSKKTDELHMSGAEFDRIMRGVLQSYSEEMPKKKITTKSKKMRKKTSAK